MFPFFGESDGALYLTERFEGDLKVACKEGFIGRSNGKLIFGGL